VRIGVITFPGSLDDRDAARAVRLAGAEPVGLWHGDRGLRGVDEESVYDILLAATEACTNVLTHGGRKVRGYEVVTSLGAVGCQVEVADEGVGLAPGSPALSSLSNSAERGAPDPQQTPIAQLPESGRGLAIMRACVDNVTLDSRPGRGTVVTMRKRIRWPDDAPLRQLRAAS